MKRFVWMLTLLLLLNLTGCEKETQSASTDPTRAELTFDDSLKEARLLYEEGRFSESLEGYLAVMEQAGKNMEARLGAAQCQSALGLKDAAVKNLLLAQKINPEEKRVYTDLAALAQEQESEALVREVIALAQVHQVEIAREVRQVGQRHVGIQELERLALIRGEICVEHGKQLPLGQTPLPGFEILLHLPAIVGIGDKVRLAGSQGQQHQAGQCGQ